MRRKYGTRECAYYFDDRVVAFRQNGVRNLCVRGRYALTDVDADAGLGHNPRT
jgi:hypothetical protein